MILLVTGVLVLAAVHAWRRGDRWWTVALLASAVPTAAATVGFVVALAVLLAYLGFSMAKRARVS